MHTRYASSVFLCCACLSGQAVTENARELALTKTVDAGITTIHLHNAYSAPATAWIVECHGETAPGRKWTSQWHWVDHDLGLGGNPLAPGKETDFRARQPLLTPRTESTGSCDDYHVIAAVFADGTVSGDLVWINAILDERRKAYRDIAKATDMLNKAKSDKTDRSVVIQQFAEWQNAELPRPRLGRPSPSYGETWGSSSQSLPPGRPQVPEAIPPSRPFPRAAVPGVTLWLIQEKEEVLPEAIRLLSEWRERLGQMRPVTDAAKPASPLDKLRNMPAREPQPDLIGKQAPAFTLKDVDGRELALKDLRGKTVFLDFWATWCEPCRKDMPQIKALYDEFKDKGLVVIGIDFSEPAETAKKFFDEKGLPFRNLLDPGRETFKKYGAGGIPKVVLIDKDGIVRYFQQGYNSRQDFRAEVMKLGLE